MHATRRAFLQRLGITTAALALRPEPARTAEPGELVIIDTHTHFYDPSRPEGVPWPPPGDSQLYRTVLPGDYQKLPVLKPVAGTVVVEASPWVEDNAWLLELAENAPFIKGICGNLDPRQPDFVRNLERFSKNPLFRGIRVGGRQLHQHANDSEYVAGLKRLADLDLQLDVNGSAAQLEGVARLAAAIPSLRIVVDHLANTRIDGTGPAEDWLRQMRSAARAPGVYAKVSGLVEATGRTPAPRDVDYYRPWLDALVDLFGEDRLIYGSNWPVSERFAPLAVVQSLVHDYFTARGRTALSRVFSENARSAYKWRPRT